MVFWIVSVACELKALVKQMKKIFTYNILVITAEFSRFFLRSTISRKLMANVSDYIEYMVQTNFCISLYSFPVPPPVILLPQMFQSKRCGRKLANCLEKYIYRICPRKHK